MPVIVNGETIDEQVLRDERSRLRRQFADVYESMQPAAAREWLQTFARHNIVSQVLLRQEAWRDAEPIPAESVDREIHRLFGSDRRTVAIMMRIGLTWPLASR